MKLDDGRVNHSWTLEQDTYEVPRNDLFVHCEPTGFGSFICSCGTSVHGPMSEVSGTARAHLGIEE